MLEWEAKQAAMQGKLIAYESCNKRINQREIIELESEYKFSEKKLVNNNKIKHREKKTYKNTINMIGDIWNVSKCKLKKTNKNNYACKL